MRSHSSSIQKNSLMWLQSHKRQPGRSVSCTDSVWNEYLDLSFDGLHLHDFLPSQCCYLPPPHPPLYANANALKQIIIHDLTSVPASLRVQSEPALMQERKQNRIFSIWRQARTHMHQTGCCFDIAEGNSPHFQNRSCFSARFPIKPYHGRLSS